MKSSAPSKRSPLWMAAFAAPPFIVMGVTLIVALWGGELYRIDDVSKLQDNSRSPTLFGSAYSTQDAPYKLKRIEQECANVLTLGSSRILDTRREFIDPNLSFFNGGRIASDIWVSRQALQKLPPGCLPDYIILGLDQYSFNSQYTEYIPENITPEIISSKFDQEEQGLNRFTSIWPSILADLFKGKVRLIDPPGPYQCIGFAAKAHTSGFRNDGSYRYGTIIDVAPEKRSTTKRLAKSFEEIAESEDFFVHGDSIHQATIDEVAKLLDWCIAHDIKVIAYLPPFAPSVVTEMRKPGGNFSYLDKLLPAIQPLFTARQIPLFDFTHFKFSTDDEFIDGFHCSERVSAKMLLEMAGRSLVAGEIVDEAAIEQLLKNSSDPLVLLP